MAEYIEREALKAEFEEDGHLSAYIEEMIDSIPAADVQKVKRGKWKRNDRGNYNCTNCKSEYDAVFGFAFCPNCGADMRETNNEEA